MKLTRASSYALQALAYMAAQETQNTIASHKIAENRDIPERFLLKVLKPLVEQGVLESVKGPNGGYRLARRPSEITVLEVIEAVDHSIRGQVPIDVKDEQGAAIKARLERVCNKVAEVVREQLQKVNLADLLNR